LVNIQQSHGHGAGQKTTEGEEITKRGGGDDKTLNNKERVRIPVACAYYGCLIYGGDSLFNMFGSKL
jgi:hypothetical protein